MMRLNNNFYLIMASLLCITGCYASEKSSFTDECKKAAEHENIVESEESGITVYYPGDEDDFDNFFDKKSLNKAIDREDTEQEKFAAQLKERLDFASLCRLRNNSVRQVHGGYYPQDGPRHEAAAEKLIRLALKDIRSEPTPREGRPVSPLMLAEEQKTKTEPVKARRDQIKKAMARTATISAPLSYHVAVGAGAMGAGVDAGAGVGAGVRIQLTDAQRRKAHQIAQETM